MMDKKSILIFLVGLIAGATFYYLVSQFLFAPIITTVFSPYGGEKEIMAIINNAQKTIDIEMYEFTSKEVSASLVKASERGVKIRLILEKRITTKENEKNYEKLNGQNDAEVRWASDTYKLTHSKFIIADGKKVYVGSHNLSDAALKGNREAGVIIEDSKTIKDFKKIFEQDWILAS